MDYSLRDANSLAFLAASTVSGQSSRRYNHQSWVVWNWASSHSIIVNTALKRHGRANESTYPKVSANPLTFNTRLPFQPRYLSHSYPSSGSCLMKFTFLRHARYFTIPWLYPSYFFWLHSLSSKIFYFKAQLKYHLFTNDFLLKFLVAFQDPRLLNHGCFLQDARNRGKM